MSNKNNNIYPVGAIKHDDEHRASIPTTELAKVNISSSSMTLTVDATLSFIGWANM